MSEQLKWTKQATQVKIKLNRAIGIPNKLKNITNRNTKWLIILYLTPNFTMGPNYKDKRIQKTKQIEIVQNKAIRKITFKKHFDQTGSLISILWYCASPKLFFISQSEHNGKLTKPFFTLKQCGDNHS